jgi:hypothetical protein
MKSNSSVAKSEHFDLIMDNYKKYGKKMSIRGFWQKYIIPIEPNIKYLAWKRFVDKLEVEVINRTENIIQKYIDEKVTETQMEQDSLRNIMAISKATIDDIVANPELLATVPVKERMKWLFGAMKAKDSRMVALTKVQSEKRKTTMYEDMMEAAQYGEIEEDDFEEALPEKTFSPNEL